MAGKYSSQNITVSVDSSPGGSLQAITSYVLTVGGIKLTSEIEDATTFGLAFRAFLPSGMASAGPVTLEGFWDTTATSGSHTVLNAPDDGPQDATRTLTFGLGDSKTFSGECYLMSYEVIPDPGKLTRFRAELQPTGTWAFA